MYRSAALVLVFPPFPHTVSLLATVVSAVFVFLLPSCNSSMFLITPCSSPHHSLISPSSPSPNQGSHPPLFPPPYSSTTIASIRSASLRSLYVTPGRGVPSNAAPSAPSGGSGVCVCVDTCRTYPASSLLTVMMSRMDDGRSAKGAMVSVGWCCLSA